MGWWSDAQRWRRAHPRASDAALALVVLAIGLTGQPNPETGHSVPLTVPVLGLLLIACGSLVVRRLAPVAVWCVTLLASATTVVLVDGPAPAVVAVMVAIYTVATLRRPMVALAVTAVTPVVLLSSYAVAIGGGLPANAVYTLAAVSTMACAVGFAVRSNRALLAAAEERARVAEQTREEEAQRRVTEERLRIARELHDVVAHHIAVINVQSGVARHLLDTDTPAAADALGHVREESAIVLREMSTVLGLLRGDDDARGTAPPAPSLSQVDALVDSVRRSGTAVTMRTTGSPRRLAPGTDLAAFRIVQEGLTNAGKHGGGSASVALDYRDDALVIDVVNELAPGRPVSADHAGHGLVGMHERVAALGGSLEAGAQADGRYVVHAELPAGAPS